MVIAVSSSALMVGFVLPVITGSSNSWSPGLENLDTPWSGRFSQRSDWRQKRTVAG